MLPQQHTPLSTVLPPAAPPRHLRRAASVLRMARVASQKGGTVGMSTCSSGECAPLQHTRPDRRSRSRSPSHGWVGRRNQGSPSPSIPPPRYAPTHTRTRPPDGGPIADALQARQLLADDAALQPRVDCLDHRGGACSGSTPHGTEPSAPTKQSRRRSNLATTIIVTTATAQHAPVTRPMASLVTWTMDELGSGAHPGYALSCRGR